MRGSLFVSRLSNSCEELVERSRAAAGRGGEGGPLSAVGRGGEGGPLSAVGGGGEGGALGTEGGGRGWGDQ